MPVPFARSVLLACAVVAACAQGEGVDEASGGGLGVGGSLEGGAGASGGGAGKSGGGSGGAFGAGGGGKGGGAGGSGGASGGGAGAGGTGGASTGGSGGASTGGASTGGASTGGASTGGSGGASTGGASSGGAGGSGGTGGACQVGWKRCGGLCTEPNTSVGCALTGCDACPNPPPNSNPVCTGDVCDFSCVAGYQQNAAGTGCEPVGGTGGGIGTGGSGTGGSGGGCNPANCTNFCIPVWESRCCRSNGTCGCKPITGSCS